MNCCHILIHPDEDGNCVSFLTDAELHALLVNPVEERGVRNFIKVAQLAEHEVTQRTEPLVYGKNPQYWPEGTAMLLEIKSVGLRTVAVQWEITRDE